MAQRVTIRKRTPYNTTSNKRRVIKTPGGKLVYHHLKKAGTAPKCGDCGVALPGVPALRPRQYATISKRQKTVQRAYGGSRCGDCVKSRILRAFLVEEAKIVKKVIKSQTTRNTHELADSIVFWGLILTSEQGTETVSFGDRRPQSHPLSTDYVKRGFGKGLRPNNSLPKPTTTVMHFAHLIRDVWAPSPTLLDEQTFLLSEVIFGHFIHHFSTPASFMTWDKDIPRRIQDLLQWVVASGHTKIRPSCAFRAMLVILSIKKDIPNAVAFNDDIELLFMMAFKSLAATYYDPTFTDSVFDTLTDARYVGTKIEHYPHYLQGHLAQAVDDQRRKKFTAKIMEVVKFYLSPFLDAEVGGIPDESPAMPSYCELVRREPARHEQSLAFPDTLRKMSPLSPVMEEEMSAADPIHTMEDVEVGGMPENTTDAAGLSDFTIPTFPSFETETDSSSVSNPFDDKPQNSSIPSFPSSLTSMDSSASMGPAEGSKFHENISAQRAALPFPRARKVHFDVKDPGSSGSSSSSSSSSPSMHGVRHNPATQLNAVFEGQPAKASSTRFSAPMYESDPFPDPYSMSPTNVHQDSWGSRPETFVHAIDAFPMKQVRQWKANRRGKKAFAESGSSKPRSSNSSKSKLLPRLNSTRARARVVDHDDSSRLLARREAPDAQASAHGKWKRSSSPRPWKRLLVLPVAYVRLRIGQFRYGYE